MPEGTVKLIRSFHQGMSAKIRVGGSMSEKLDVSNGLRQGCCMSPVLFNLFSCAVMERWIDKLDGKEGVGIPLNYKYDQKLH